MTDGNNLLELPKGWNWAAGSDLFKFITSGSRGWAQYYSETGSIFLRIGNLDHDSISLDLKDIQRVQAPKDVEGTRTRVEAGDVLISITADVGMIAVVPPNFEEAFINQHVALARPVAEVNTSYVGWYLASREGGQKQFKLLQRGATKVGLGLDDIRAVKVPFPPVAEQRRIVAKIEELFTKLDAGVAALKTAQAQLKRYRQAVLKAAVEGELTREWREKHKDELEPASVLLERILRERRTKWEADQLAKMHAQGKPPKDDKWKEKYQEPVQARLMGSQKLPVEWECVSGDCVFTFVTSGSRGWSSYYSDTGALFLRMGNLDHDSITLDFKVKQRVQPPDDTEGTRTRVMSKDILISITADVGMIAVIPETFEEAYINQHVALARPVSAINEKFVAWFLASKDGGNKQFREFQRGATKLGLGLDDIKTVCLPLPPIAEQKQLVAEVERRFSISDEIEAALTAELKRAERLRQAILKRAFEGKLVPQDPNDEPAAVLLERIQQARATQAASAATNGKRQPRKRKTSAAAEPKLPME